MRVHLLAPPQTVSIPEYSMCPFTSKTRRLATMLWREGHHVIHYGHELSRIQCAEHVTVTTGGDLGTSFPGWDFGTMGPPPMRWDLPILKSWTANIERELDARLQPGDFIFVMYGCWQRAAVEKFSGHAFVVEPAIGYPDGAFADFRAHESYAIMHAMQGERASMEASDRYWYDAVIPPGFDLDDFHFKASKDGNYMLFLGRVCPAKGAHIAVEVAEKLEMDLIVAGCISELPRDTKHVKYRGIVDRDRRRALLADASCVLMPTRYLEPFGYVQVEAMLSGTPVIASDRGAFAEVIHHGVSGFRCRTFEQFCWAAQNVCRIDPFGTRRIGEKYDMRKIAPMHTDFMQSIAQSQTEDGWYSDNPDRVTLWRSSIG